MSEGATETPRDILRKIRHVELKTRGLVAATFAGQYRSVFKGRGMNFEEVREYQPGDEVRTIDWNVTARFGEMHGNAFVKKFTEERELTVVLMVDVSASGRFGGIELFSDHVELFIPPKKGRPHTLRLIREILFFDPKGRGTKPGPALDYLNRVVTRRAVVFLISDFQADDFTKELSVTARRHDLVAIPVVDPREKELPDIGTVTLEDAETGEQIQVNTSNRATRDAYAHLAEKRRDAMAKMLLRLGIDSIELQTDSDYIPALRGFFRTRERRLARG